ncbi:MAG: 3-deoxy-7-phosphoheptulonate synthase [Segniliparus sp.]|uniref:3-deoxy-7-phosphoheptulonate synthase n=1 Tax=Segniliparus sp. TaxID=2804064 RepID=UPI003F389018
MQSVEILTQKTREEKICQFSPHRIGGQHQIRAVISPEQLLSELPLTESGARTVRDGRVEVQGVLTGADDRLLVVVGPCSIHDAKAGLVYMESLGALARSLSEDLVVVARVYVEKPRTVAGWTGLLADPALDGNLNLSQGLYAARALMLQVAEQGLAIATEWLSPVTPHYLADLVSWGAIGARTVESQVHRQMASGLPMPIGMKNSVTGSVKVALDAIRFAAQPHAYVAPGPHGAAATLHTSGNPDCHLVLRGSSKGPNYLPFNIRDAEDALAAAGLPARLVIDASHGNSGKDHERQALVAREIGEQVAQGDTTIRGVMLESFLVAGRQELGPGELVFGQSVTDACMGWENTAAVLQDLAASVRRRRENSRDRQARIGTDAPLGPCLETAGS